MGGESSRLPDTLREELDETFSDYPRDAGELGDFAGSPRPAGESMQLEESNVFDFENTGLTVAEPNGGLDGLCSRTDEDSIDTESNHQVVLVSLKALMNVAVEFKKDRELPNRASRRTDHLWSLVSLKVAIPAIPAVLEIPEIRVTDRNGAQMIRTLVAQAGADIWKCNDLGATVAIGYGEMIELTVQGGMT